MSAKLTLSDDATNSPLNMTERSAAPSAPDSGDVYMDDGTNTASGLPGLRRYTGSAWEDIGGATVLQSDTSDVSNPPTDAELDSAFGTPATVGSGFTAILDDNGGDANLYLVTTNGTSWWYVALTKAT